VKRDFALALAASAPTSTKITSTKITAATETTTAAKITTPAKIPASAEAPGTVVEIAAATEPAITIIAAAIIRSRPAKVTALGLRCGDGGRGREFAALAWAVEIIAARRRTQHPAGARIGVEPLDTPVRPHPFEMIMFRSARTRGGTVGVIKLARMRAAHFGKNPVQWLHAGRAIFHAPALGANRSRKTDGQSRYHKNKAQAHGHFLAFFK